MENVVSKRLTELREEKGFSIYKLAQTSGVSASHIQRIEKEEKCPTIETLNRICKGLGITLTDFFSIENKSLPIEYLELINNMKNLPLKQIEAINLSFKAEMAKPKFLDNVTLQKYNYCGQLKKDEEVNHKRVGRPVSDNPKDKTIKFRIDEETDEMLAYCNKKLNLSRAEIIRTGIKWIYEFLIDKN